MGAAKPSKTGRAGRVRRGPGMVTLKDVARRAGVSPITVSRAVNDSGYVAAAVRKRVASAVAALGYVPNTVARSLRSRQTHTLALVLTDISNPFFTTVARGVEDAASDAGFMLIICNTDEREEEEQKYVRMLLQQRVDGVLLVPARGATASLKLLQRHGIPVVVLDRRAGDAKTDSVRCDSEGGGFQLGRLLAGLGHRKVALLGGPAGVSTSDDRLSGFVRAFAAAGAPAGCRVHHGELTRESGERMAREAMQVAPRPTAVFAVNNFIAIGALGALREMGLEVPRDVALVGFDDLPAPLMTFPFLTVVTQPAYDMGRQAVTLLLERLAGRGPRQACELVLPTELIVRQSSGALRPNLRTRRARG